MSQNQPTVANVLEIDSSDADSAYNDSIGSASYLTSLSSSIKNYKYENGRRYHGYREGSYILPNDDEEQDRMDLLHHIYSLLTGGRLHLSPIGEHPQRVLDIGTGTGIWAIHFAEEYPSAQVIGTDLSPIQPQWVPPNCAFEIDDFEADWLYTKKFDFIHGRELEGCIADHDRLFKQAFDHLKPGGWFELQCAEASFFSDDGTAERAEYSHMFVRHMHDAGEKFGKTFKNITEWKEKFKQVGFVDVQDQQYKIPIGRWPKDPTMKEIGKFQQVQQIQGIESYAPALLSRVLGWNKLEIDVLISKARNELKDPSLHMYIPTRFVYGKKPEED